MSIDNDMATSEERMPQAPIAVPAEPATRPRTRWAAILWGLALGAVGGGALWIVLSPARLDGFADWLVGLTPLAVVAYSALALGALLLVAGLAGLARRAQRRLTPPVVE